MKTKKSHLSGTKAARLRNGGNCRGYKVEDKEDGTVSKQVKNGLSFSLVVCNYGKVQELYDTSAIRQIKKQTRRKIWLKSCFCGGGKRNTMPYISPK